MAVAAGRGPGADRSLGDHPGPRLLASVGIAVTATSLACALVLVIRRLQVPLDTSGAAPVAAMVGGIILVTVVDAVSGGIPPAARSLQRWVVRLGLALILASTLPGPAALLAPPFPALRTVAILAALIVLLTPAVPWPGSRPPPGVRRQAPGRPARGTGARPAPPRRRRRDADPPRRSPGSERGGGAGPPAPDVGATAGLKSPEAPSPPFSGLLQQRFERFVVPEERVECLRGTLHLTVVAGTRLATGHVGFCPPFHHLPLVDVGTACEEVEATILAAEVLPWGVRIECRLDEPADETIRIPVEVVARAPLPTADESPPSSTR